MDEHRRRVWPWVVTGTFIVGASIATVVVLKFRAESRRRWNAFVERHDALIDRLRLESGDRPSLAGAGEDGNAWNDYNAVLPGLKQFAPDLRSALEDLAAGRAYAKKIETLRAGLAVHETALARMRAGARRPRALFPIAFEKGPYADLPGLLASQNAVTLLMASARMRRTDGDVDGALDECAVGLQFACDLANVPSLIATMIGIALKRQALDEMKEIIADARTTPAQLERMDRLLQEAEKQFPSSTRMMEGDHALAGYTLRQVESGDTRALGMSGSFLITRGMLAQTAEDHEEIVEAHRRGDALPWAQAEAHMQSEDLRIRARANMLSKLMIPGLMAARRALVEIQARSRVVRAATMARRGLGPDAPGWPEDPFAAGPVLREGNVLRSIWSNGRRDEKGGWTGDRNSDLVLELPK